MKKRSLNGKIKDKMSNKRNSLNSNSNHYMKSQNKVYK